MDSVPDHIAAVDDDGSDVGGRGGEDRGLQGQVAGDAGAEVVRYRGASAPEAGQQSVEATVPGRPDWKLVASLIQQAYREVAPPRLREAVKMTPPRVLERRRD